MKNIIHKVSLVINN